MDNTSQREQFVEIPQDGIFPERDARNNSEQAQLTRAAVDEQWRLEHSAPRPILALLEPHLAAQVDLIVYYADENFEREMPLSQAWLFAVDAYMLGKPFTLYAVGITPDDSAIMLYYDGDVLRSEYDAEWARAWIKAGVDVVQEVAAGRVQQADRASATAPTDEPTAEPQDEAGTGVEQDALEETAGPEVPEEAG